MLGSRFLTAVSRSLHPGSISCFLSRNARTSAVSFWKSGCIHSLATAAAFNDGGARPFDEIPAPRVLPVVGSLWDYIFGKGDHFTMTHELQLDRCRKYGKIYRERFGSTDFVFVADPNSIETVMRAETASPRKPAIKPWIEARVELGYQGGILSDDLEEWRRFRTPLNKLVLRPKQMQATFTQGINEVVCDFVQYLEKSRDRNPGPGQYLIEDIAAQSRKLSLEAIGLIVYGKRLNMLTKVLKPETEEFIESLLCVFSVFTELRMSYSFHKLLKSRAWHSNKDGWRKNFEFNSKLVAELQEQLTRRIEGTVDDTHKDYYGTSLLEQLLLDSSQTRSEIVLTGMDMFSAGMETVGSAMTWILHHLAKNPDIQDRVCDESISLLGKDRLRGTPAELQRMTLTKNVIKESLRLASIFPSNFRILDTDVDLMGYRVPAGTPIGFCHHYINKSPEHFHQPWKFNPDRWLREGKNIHPFASVPFGFGARMCPGRRVSELEMLVAVHTICRKFRLESANTTDVKQKLHAMLVPDRPVNIRFLDRHSC